MWAFGFWGTVERLEHPALCALSRGSSLPGKFQEDVITDGRGYGLRHQQRRKALPESVSGSPLRSKSGKDMRALRLQRMTGLMIDVVMAERVGFEPTVPFRTTVFET